ncbi:hypothetical protein QKD39_gp16 [Psittacine adenovirus 1]|uniref:Uncharacterized protein n=1 Tax=Psittacine adenovirus 1 TaxID=318592 RepID=A0A2Z5E022_9ADEN|nr:hypothetical protein QKD39_gp16 [Psittacine adenovirus 1]AXB73005.1 hypothetical protein [Psittacine adenovirus 1]
MDVNRNPSSFAVVDDDVVVLTGLKLNETNSEWIIRGRNAVRGETEQDPVRCRSRRCADSDSIGS